MNTRNPSTRVLLTFYERAGCHLCEDMLLTLLEFRDELPFDLERVDVDDSSALADRYGHLVPVLALGEVEICHYHLDKRALERHVLGAGDRGNGVA